MPQSPSTDELRSGELEEFLSGKGEAGLLKTGAKLFRTRFPNPDRIDCPGTNVLKSMASRALASIPEDFLDHLTCCSPCFVEYEAFLSQARTRARRLKAIAACVALLALLGTAYWFSGDLAGFLDQPPTAVEGPSTESEPVVAVLDLRQASVGRGGAQGPPSEPRPTIPRNATTLQIHLPIGSEEGEYEVGLFPSEEQPVVRTEGSAELHDHHVILEVNLNLAPVSPGEYLLGIRRGEFSWRYHAIDVEE